MRERITETWGAMPEPVRKLGKDCASACAIALLTVFGVHASKWMGLTGGQHPFQSGNPGSPPPRPRYQSKPYYQPQQRHWAQEEQWRRNNPNGKGGGHGRG